MRKSCKKGNYKIIGFADKNSKRVMRMFFLKIKLINSKLIDLGTFEGKEEFKKNYFFYKSILRKVSFNALLFEKELSKALNVLSEREGVRLYRWSLVFTKSYPELQANLNISY